MASYAFATSWSFPAPIEKVWEAIFSSARWPEWWKGLERVVEIEPGDAERVGCVRRFTWKGPLPYRLIVDLRVIRVERPTAIESLASGELEGRGTWSLSQDAQGTRVRYDWNVCTTKRWMNLAAPFARPLFAWNHDLIMRNGEMGLRRWLASGREEATVRLSGVR